MSYCKHCGNQLEEGVKFCPKCGTAAVHSPPADAAPQPEPATPPPPAQEEAPPPTSQVFSDFEKKFAEAMDNAVDSTAEFDPKDIEANKIMALFSYLGILVIIPILAARESKFARFHANQGLVLLIVAFAYTLAVNIVSGILAVISWHLASLCSLLNLAGLAFLAMVVMGILNSLNGKAKELPIIGKYKLLK